MATYFVDGNAGNDSGDGSTTRPWRTIGKAEAQVQPGDEVRLRSGTYREVVTLRQRNTTWKADTGHNPVIDGRYNDSLFRPDGSLPHPDSSFLPPSSTASLVVIREEGIVLEGVTVKNSAGAGISVSAGNVTIRRCRIDFNYDSPIRVNPGAKLIDNVVVENNICTRASVKYFDRERTGTSPHNVSGVIKMGRTRDGIIRNNICAYGFGEGINIGKGSYRTLVEGNIVHSCNHVHIYVNRSVDTIVRNNMVYHSYHPDSLGENGRPPTGIVIGDENTKTDSWPGSAGGQVYNNIVVGMGMGFGVRNGKNYNTQLDKCYVGYNTFIGGRLSEVGIQVAGNQYNRPHRDSLVENNIICNVPRMVQVTGDVSGITFRNNLWSQQPEQSVRGPGDRIGDPVLANPTANIRDTFPNYEENIDPRNYQLTTRSSLAIDRANTARNFTAFTLPVVRTDFYGAERQSASDIGAHEFDGVTDDPVANFSIGLGEANGTVPHTVNFVNESTSTHPIVFYEWDFGDGDKFNGVNARHTYQTPGVFTVTLTIRDDQGNEDTTQQTGAVTIEENSKVIIPPSFRRFVVVHPEGVLPIEEDRVIAYGVQYPDLRAILIWKDAPRHMLNFSGIDDVVRSLVVAGSTELLWVDENNENEPLVSGDEEIEIEIEGEVESLTAIFITG